MTRSRLAHAAIAALLLAAPAGAQTSAPGAGGTQPTQPATAPTPAPTPLNFSGVIFGNFNYQLPTSPAQLRNQTNNAFVVDRAYLTFRMPAGERTSIRITTDVFQSTDSSSNAYTVRAKYAYLQYDAPKFRNGAQVTGRIGILQNVLIDHMENFWPRYLSQAATERAGYFASADVGVAGLVTLPSKMGEIYATVVNGPGYTARERDRFKDYAIRLTLTPLLNTPASSLLQTFTITAWGYKGATASGFVNGGAGQVGAVGEALDRSRAGLFVGLRDPRLVLGGELAQRHDGGETGLNTALSPRGVTETTGRLLSAFTVARPLAFASASGRSPFGIVARYDHVSPSTSTTGFVTPPSTSNAYHNVIGGVFFDLSQKAQIALDYQESLASSNGSSNAPPTPLHGYFAHFVVNF
ncbi:MAG TPA: hypothetical protein VGP25_08700 [Gemmatimonadaceae bacterium]|jgi:hypothetical protein|nr:hypothetical protein [Gemmatimonadaceae bacterium]